MGHSSRYRPQKAYLEKKTVALRKFRGQSATGRGASLANQLIADDAAL